MPTVDRTLLVKHAYHTMDGVIERAFHLEAEGERALGRTTGEAAR